MNMKSLLLSFLVLISECSSFPTNDCEVPVKITAHIPGIGGVVDINALPVICPPTFRSKCSKKT